MDESLKPITKDTIIFARPDGWHYHLDRNCEMLQGSQFERLGYIRILQDEIEGLDLFPCPSCAIKEEFKRGHRK